MWHVDKYDSGVVIISRVASLASETAIGTGQVPHLSCLSVGLPFSLSVGNEHAFYKND